MRQPLVDATGRAIGNPGGFPPDRRYGIRRVMGCRGLPSNIYGNNGDVATDPTTGKVYVKSNNAWAFMGQGFQRLFQSGGGSGSLVCVNGDPFLYEDQFPYALGSSGIGNVVNLSWTYPSNLGAPTSVNSVTLNTRLYLQRSTSATNTVLAPASSGVVATGPLGVPINGSPPVDPNWTTISSWLPGVNFPSSYQDTISDGFHTHNYRLIQFSNAAGEGVEQLLEIDWNVTTAMIPYVVTPDNRVDGVHVSWA